MESLLLYSSNYNNNTIRATRLKVREDQSTMMHVDDYVAFDLYIISRPVTRGRFDVAFHH